MPIIKPKRYKGRPAFNQAWANMTRLIHMEMLAKPNPRRLRPWPDPIYVQPLPVQIPPATLNYNASKRIRILSRVPRGKYTPKYRELPPAEHFVEPYNLNFVPTPRLLELAKPRVRLYRFRGRKSMSKKMKRKWKTLEKERELRERREAWLALRAAPKPPPPMPPIIKWKRRTIPLTPEEREIRIFQLSIPMRKHGLSRISWDPYAVNPRSQRAVASKRILELAAHRELPEEARLDLAFKPFKIKKSALKYKASKRIIDLAEPVLKRTAGNNDVREDAFQVPARALKAMCSKRTKELAKPIIRRAF